jgi:hypothetical protein
MGSTSVPKRDSASTSGPASNERRRRPVPSRPFADGVADMAALDAMRTSAVARRSVAVA